MATVLVHPAPHSVASARRTGERRFALVLVTALTLFAVLVHGYHPYAEDGGLYIAGVKRLLDSALYPQDSEFVLAPTRFSLFAPLVAGIVRSTDLKLPWVLLLLYVSSVWTTLFAAWILTARCWPERQQRAGAVALLACWLALPVAGTALLFLDPYLTARSFSTPCMVLALAGGLDISTPGSRRRGWAVWIASMGIAGAMHPLMATYALAAGMVFVCLRAEKQSIRVGGTFGLCGAGVAIALLLQLAAPTESVEMVRVAMTRRYWFVGTWTWYEWIGLLAPLAILALFASKRLHRLAGQELENARRALALTGVVLGATSLGIAVLFARQGAASHMVARLQPLRAFQTVYLTMILMLGGMLGGRVLRRSILRWSLTLGSLGAIMLAGSRSAYSSSNHLEMPSSAPKNSWAQAFVWVRDNTPRNALFALDADYISAPGEDAQTFRAIAERSALADYSKDGGEASIAPALTRAWVLGETAQQDLSAETDAQRVATLRPLGVTWVVLRAGAKTDFDCPYRSEAVMVCRLP